MQNPLEVTFHDLIRNESIEQLIEEKFMKLIKIRPDITKCHVFFEKQSKHHQKANRTIVRLDLKVPHFQDIVVSDECSEDIAEMKTTVIKTFKRSQDLLLEKVKYHRDLDRADRKESISENQSEEEEYV
ncbi:MAG: HPF/RaiA family ribosome-associated protein [Candidatus Omnitrophica bacterium]|nr:HPF/RaiA family ribosome-associated protein [Candidatus Omnitrophota bacterium]